MASSKLSGMRHKAMNEQNICCRKQSIDETYRLWQGSLAGIELSLPIQEGYYEADRTLSA